MLTSKLFKSTTSILLVLLLFFSTGIEAFAYYEDNQLDYEEVQHTCLR